MKNVRSFSFTLLTFLTAFALYACSQTVSLSSNDEDYNEHDKLQPNLPTDSTSNITAPSLKTVTVSDDGSSEAKEYFRGMEKADFLERYKTHGTENLKEMADTIQKGIQHFDLAAKSDKWFIPATIQKGNLYLIAAKSLKNQECMDMEQLDLIVETLSIIQQTIAYYGQAQTIFQQGIDTARKKKLKGEAVQIQEEYYINTYFEECNAYWEMATLYQEAPLPDSAAVVKEYVEYDRVPMEDAIEMTHEDLEAYREELSSKFRDAKSKAILACESGIQEAQKYNLENGQVEATKGLLWLLDPENLALQ